ncbi:MAG: FtsX-like permease family protein [Paludibacter sp.]|jgi:ABC-type lipoprotein release transport system permease subunit|nr:FtsX-like permease family protein [Paludibacter sp.]
MTLIKTAFRSLIGNGLKTWLNVFVLSISFVMIILMQGILQGWSKQATEDAVRWEIADGQYWQEKYDPHDPFTLDSSTVKIPEVFATDIKNHLIEPVLITQGTIYPDGRMQGVLLKGIQPNQQLLEIPTDSLNKVTDEIPVVMGAYMARQAKLKLNDVLTLRWRDSNGTFEAADIRIVGIFKTTVPAIDVGTLWLPLDRLQAMTLNEGCANILIKSPEKVVVDVAGWDFKSTEKLTEATLLMVKTKSIGTSVFYVIFLLLAMLAIFDTQTLSIFRRQKEIGTMIALGMTRKQVVRHFTMEGSLYAILALAFGTVWGAPLFYFMVEKGITFPVEAADFGIPMGDTMYAVISPGLVIGTVLFIFIVTAVVSYLPAKKIAKMNPTEAIRGKAL